MQSLRWLSRQQSPKITHFRVIVILLRCERQKVFLVVDSFHYWIFLSLFFIGGLRKFKEIKHSNTRLHIVQLYICTLHELL